jgi:hypothetical protein
MKQKESLLLDEIDHILLLLSCNGAVDITRSEFAVASVEICVAIIAKGVLSIRDNSQYTVQ